MKQLKYEETGLLLSHEEARTFEKALLYILHRLKEHDECGARSVGTVESVEKLLREIKKNI